jgi:hypothetical protein
MTTLIEAAKQALEALETIVDAIYVNSQQEANAVIKSDKAITALRTAIEAAEKQDPVGVVHHKPTSLFGADCEQVAVFTRALAPGTKLYDTPPAVQRQPLTKERIGQIIAQCQITLVNYCSDEKQIEFARAVEAAHEIK